VLLPNVNVIYTRVLPSYLSIQYNFPNYLIGIRITHIFNFKLHTDTMASGSVFSETLQTITTTKLEELAQQRVAFEKGYAALLTAVKAERDPLKRLLLLVDGTKSCLGVKTASRKTKDGRSGRVLSGGTRNRRLETDLRNLDRFLEQARFDPSVSEKVLQDCENTMLQYLLVQSSKYQYIPV
jgi:hypothetical protein